MSVRVAAEAASAAFVFARGPKSSMNTKLMRVRFQMCRQPAHRNCSSTAAPPKRKSGSWVLTHMRSRFILRESLSTFTSTQLHAHAARTRRGHVTIAAGCASARVRSPVCGACARGRPSQRGRQHTHSAWAWQRVATRHVCTAGRVCVVVVGCVAHRSHSNQKKSTPATPTRMPNVIMKRELGRSLRTRRVARATWTEPSQKWAAKVSSSSWICSSTASGDVKGDARTSDVHSSSRAPPCAELDGLLLPSNWVLSNFLASLTRPV
jgi:hypothetical protein